MNKNIVPILVIFVSVGLISIFVWKGQISPVVSSDLQGTTFFPSVKGCAETEQGMATRAVGQEIEQEPRIEVVGNQIKYSRAISHLCCRKAEIEKQARSSVIDIYEVWSGIGCRCMCHSEIEARLENIPSGSYIVNVYEKGKKSGNGGPMEEKLIISESIVIE